MNFAIKAKNCTSHSSSHWSLPTPSATHLSHIKNSQQVDFSSLPPEPAPRPCLEYGATIWDPHVDTQKRAVERVQNQAIWWIYDLRPREECSITQLRKYLGLYQGECGSHEPAQTFQYIYHSGHTWNWLCTTVVESGSIDTFKRRLSALHP